MSTTHFCLIFPRLYTIRCDLSYTGYLVRQPFPKVSTKYDINIVNRGSLPPWRKFIYNPFCDPWPQNMGPKFDILDLHGFSVEWSLKHVQWNNNSIFWCWISEMVNNRNLMVIPSLLNGPKNQITHVSYVTSNTDLNLYSKKIVFLLSTQCVSTYLSLVVLGLLIWSECQKE